MQYPQFLLHKYMTLKWILTKIVSALSHLSEIPEWITEKI